MMRTTIKGVLGPLLGTALVVFGPSSSAHTTIADSAVTEGERTYTAATIPHGCDGTPVRAMSMIWPTGDNPVALDHLGNAVDLADHFVNIDHSGNPSPLASGSGVPISPRYVQDKNAFRTITNTDDSNGDRVGATHNFGYLQSDLTAWVPFRMSPPHFKDTSCATSAVVKVGILNGCNKSQTDPARVDAWVGVLTTKYNDPTVVSVGFWPRVTVSRDLVNNPHPSGFDVADCPDGELTLDIRANDQQIDDYLGIPGYWPNP